MCCGRPTKRPPPGRSTSSPQSSTPATSRPRRRAQPPATVIAAHPIKNGAPGSETAATSGRETKENGELLAAPRNPAASRASTEIGRAALARLSLAEAETAF